MTNLVGDMTIRVEKVAGRKFRIAEDQMEMRTCLLLRLNSQEGKRSGAVGLLLLGNGLLGLLATKPLVFLLRSISRMAKVKLFNCAKDTLATMSREP